MAKTMTKAPLISVLSQDTGIPKKQVADLLGRLASLASAEARNGFMIPGIGKLIVVDRKARVGRNPATGETINIPAKRVLKFRIARAARDAALD